MLLGPHDLPLSLRALRSLSRRLYLFAHQVDVWWVRRLVRVNAGPDAIRIRSYTHSWELSTLFKLAATCPLGARAVEIGSHLGASACYIAAGLHRVSGHLVCVDTWQNDAMTDIQEDTFPTFLANTAGVAGSITPIRKNSRRLDDTDLPNRYDLGFIDGDHSYDGAWADFQAVGRTIRPGGILAFHDSLNAVGVGRVIGQALATGEWVLAGQVMSLTWLRKAEDSLK